MIAWLDGQINVRTMQIYIGWMLILLTVMSGLFHQAACESFGLQNRNRNDLGFDLARLVKYAHVSDIEKRPGKL
jgi:hypothetical protein